MRSVACDLGVTDDRTAWAAEGFHQASIIQVPDAETVPSYGKSLKYIVC